MDWSSWFSYVQDMKKYSQGWRLFVVYLPLVTLAALGLVYVAVYQVPADRRMILAGQLDLTNWDFKQSLIRLDGEWEFYWDQLLTQSHFETDLAFSGTMVQVPSVYSVSQGVDSNLGAMGTATYRLKITGALPGQILGIQVPTFATSGRIFINDTLIYEEGLVGATKEETKPAYQTGLTVFEVPAESFSIIVQTANFHYARGGFWHELVLGNLPMILQRHEFFSYKDAFLIGSLLIMGLYFLFVFLSRRSERSSLYFSLLSLAALVRVAATGNVLFARIWPEFPFRLLIAVEYLTFYWLPVLFYLLIAQVFKGYCCRAVSRLLLAHTLLVSGFILAAPTNFVSGTVGYGQGHGILVMAYVLAIITSAIFKKETGAGSILFGGYVTLLFALVDILYYRNVVISQWGELFTIGLFISILMQSIALARRSAKAFRQVEDSVAREIAAEVAFLQAQIKPHFLFNALNTILSDCRSEPRRAADLIGILSDYLRASFDFKSLNSFVTIQKELELVHSYLLIEKARFGDQLNVEVSIDAEANIMIPTLSIQPLVENAINHGIRKRQGAGLVRISAVRHGPDYLISVEDDGIGIDPEHIQRLLEGQTRGIGLWNIHTRLIKYYGHGLEISSKPGQGTVIHFTVPVSGKPNYDDQPYRIEARL